MIRNEGKNKDRHVYSTYCERYKGNPQGYTDLTLLDKCLLDSSDTCSNSLYILCIKMLDCFLIHQSKNKGNEKKPG